MGIFVSGKTGYHGTQSSRECTGFVRFSPVPASATIKACPQPPSTLPRSFVDAGSRGLLSKSCLRTTTRRTRSTLGRGRRSSEYCLLARWFPAYLPNHIKINVPEPGALKGLISGFWHSTWNPLKTYQNHNKTNTSQTCKYKPRPANTSPDLQISAKVQTHAQTCKCKPRPANTNPD